MNIYQNSCGEFIPYIESIGGLGTYEEDMSHDRSPPNRKSNQRKEKWTEEQIIVLVQQWKENAFVLESNFHSGIWLKIKCVVDQNGPPKSVTNCKEKLQSLKDAYVNQRDSKKENTDLHPLSPYFPFLEEVLGAAKDDGMESFNNGNINLPSVNKDLLRSVDSGKDTPEIPMDEDCENAEANPNGNENPKTFSLRQEFKSLQRAIINARKEHEQRHDKFIRELIGEQKNAQGEERETCMGPFSF